MVLTAAETIVAEEGFSQLKVRKIAMEIGYTVGSVYMVFKNMADLIMHIKGRSLDAITEQLMLQIKEEHAAEDIIRNLATSYYQFASQHYNRWSIIFEHHPAKDESIPDWYQEKVDSIFSLIENQFKRLATQHTDEQNYLATRALWSGVHGVCTLSLTGKAGLLGGSQGEGTVTLLVNNFIQGWKDA